MISYKRIDLLKLSISTDFYILHSDEPLEIKTPIIEYILEKDSINLIINNNSDSHNTLLDICSYIDRLFNVKDISCSNVKDKNIKISIDKSSVCYDENGKVIPIKKNGKIICSFKINKGVFILKQLLFIK